MVDWLCWKSWWSLFSFRRLGRGFLGRGGGSALGKAGVVLLVDTRREVAWCTEATGYRAHGSNATREERGDGKSQHKQEPGREFHDESPKG